MSKLYIHKWSFLAVSTKAWLKMLSSRPAKLKKTKWAEGNKTNGFHVVTPFKTVPSTSSPSSSATSPTRHQLLSHSTCPQPPASSTTYLPLSRTKHVECFLWRHLDSRLPWPWNSLLWSYSFVKRFLWNDDACLVVYDLISSIRNLLVLQKSALIARW